MTTTPTPMKPWKATKKERATDISIFFLALLSSYAVVAVTPMKGKLAIFVVFFLVYMLMTSSIKGFQLGSAAAKDALVNSLVAFGAIVTVIPIASILFTVVQKGLPGISLNLFVSDMSMATPTDSLNNGGLLHAITGTLARNTSFDYECSNRNFDRLVFNRDQGQIHRSYSLPRASNERCSINCCWFVYSLGNFVSDH